MDTKRPYTFDRVVRILIGLVVVVLLFLLVKRLSNVLLPFFVAWLIAYLLHPFVHFFQYKLKFKNRILSVISVLLLFASMITGVGFLLVPMIGTEVQKIAEIISLYVQGVTVDSVVPVAWQVEIRNYLLQIDYQTVLQNESFIAVVKKVAPQLLDLLNGSISVLVGFTVVIITFMYLVFILIDYERITDGMFKVVPVKFRPIVAEVLADLEEGMNRYFRGQALVALLVAILFAIGFSIIGMPLAIVFALFMGVLNLIPYLKTIAIVPAMFIALLQSTETGQSFWSVMFWLVFVFVIIQVIEDVILVPRIMGKATGLNPAIILLSLSVWGSLMGMLGLIIALPITTLIISYYKRFVLKDVKVAEMKPQVVSAQTQLADAEVDL